MDMAAPNDQTDHDTPADSRRARLSELTRRESTYNENYSKIIRRLRVILPLLAVILSAVVFAWTLQDPVEPQTIDTTNVNARSGQNELINPRFENIDSAGQPYTITARRALQEGQDNKRVILEQPVADMLLNDGHWLALTAVNARYEHEREFLSLKDRVRLFHDHGYQMETAALDVDLAEQTVTSSDPVYAQGPAGTLEAQGLNFDLETDHLVFAGPAVMVLRSQALSDGTMGVFNE